MKRSDRYDAEHVPVGYEYVGRMKSYEVRLLDKRDYLWMPSHNVNGKVDRSWYAVYKKSVNGALADRMQEIIYENM